MIAAENIRYVAISAVLLVITMALIANSHISVALAPIGKSRRNWWRRMSYQGRHWRERNHP